MLSKRGWAVAGMGLVWVTVMVACGDDDVEIPSPSDAGASSSSSSSSGSSEGDGGDASVPYTLDDVCERTSPVLCSLRKPCCAAEYDETGCIARQNLVCQKDVAAVRGGAETFHPELIDACLPKYREVLANCTFSWELLQRYGSDLGACQAFQGKKPVGETCDRSSECLPGTRAGDLTTCDDKTKKCKVLSFLVEGEPCTLGDGATGVCASGLYCDVDFSAPGLKGFCKKSTSLAVACDKTKEPFNLECGLGHYCDKTSGKCVVGKPSGAACTGPNLECESLTCSAGDAGTCLPLEPLGKPEECKGP